MFIWILFAQLFNCVSIDYAIGSREGSEFAVDAYAIATAGGDVWYDYAEPKGKSSPRFFGQFAYLSKYSLRFSL